WLTDGTEIESNKKDRPLTRTLGSNHETGVIAGWRIGIPGMKAGGIRKLVIAPEQGYGSRPMAKIPAGSTLIFEVELVEFQPPPNRSDGPGKPMSDGSDGGTRDPGLKDIGEGLKIRDLKEGTGEPVQAGATVVV